MSKELTPADKAKIVKVLAETDQIRLAHTERRCHLFATATGGKMLQLLGVSVHRSQHTQNAFPGYDFGEFEFSVSPDSLSDVLGPFALSSTLSGVIRPVDLASKQPGGRAAG